MIKLTNLLVLIVVLAIMTLSCQNGPVPMEPESLPDLNKTALPNLSIPVGATFDSATFYIFVAQETNRTINIHRITASWEETSVTWNNFGGNYAGEVASSFIADNWGWRSADVTTLVESWLNGTFDNYGFLLDQDQFYYPRTAYKSREASYNQPYLEICYTLMDGTSECENILPIADAYIWESNPDDNNGLAEVLYTGWGWDTDLEKQSLLAFDVEIIPGQEGCTATIGYWKNHAGFKRQPDMVTPLLPIWLGNPGGSESMEVTTAAMAVDILKMNVYGHRRNGITKLYAQMLGAKLNIENGADDTDVADAIADADDFLSDFNWNDWDALGQDDKDMVEGWKDLFDDYNNGDIGPGHCDE